MFTGSMDQTINDMLKRLTIIWAIMLGGVGVYVGVTIFIIFVMGPVVSLTPDAETIFTGSLITVSLLNSGALIFLDRTFRSKSGVNGYLHGKGITALQGSLADKNLDSEDKLAAALLPHYVQLCLIRWSLAEAVGIYGLTLAFATGGALFPTCFYILSVGLMGAMKPGANEFSELINFGKATR